MDGWDGVENVAAEKGVELGVVLLDGEVILLFSVDLINVNAPVGRRYNARCRVGIGGAA
jgi:hypothetical protein